MRILHLVSTLDKGSGVMNVIMNYFRELSKQDIAFDFIYFTESKLNFKQEIANLGGKCVLINKPKLGSKYRNYLKDVIKSFKQSYDYRTLHIHEVYLAFMFSKVARQLDFKNILTHAHATSYSDRFIGKIRNRILCLNLKKHATHYLACSIAAGKFLYGKKTYENGKVRVITNAIMLEKYQYSATHRNDLRNALNYQKDDKVIGHIGRFNAQKNHQYLIDLFEKIYYQDTNYKLLLIGDGPLFELSREVVKSKKIDHAVTFLGNIPNANEYLSVMDSFVMPSLFEGLPLVGVEAQANGLISLFSSNITSEIVFKDSKQLDLKDMKAWMDALIHQEAYEDRKQTGIKNIITHGYDIQIEALKLMGFYQEIER